VVHFSLPVAGYAKRFTVSAKPIKKNLPFVKNISERIAHAIRYSGHSKGALAAHLGVPQSSVSRWLAGSEPRNDRLTEIAKFLSVDVNWLVTGKGEIAQSSAKPKELPVVNPAHLLCEDPAEYRAKTITPTDPKLLAVLDRIATALEEIAKQWHH
jgi:transcriptional regulator with XRE-family HTH domain